MTRPYTPAQVEPPAAARAARRRAADRGRHRADHGRRADLRLGGRHDLGRSGRWPRTGRRSGCWPTGSPRRWPSEFAKGGLVQRSQGKWYPGEALPRWQIGLIWRTRRRAAVERSGPAGRPVRRPDQAYEDAPARAEALARAVTADFGLPAEQLRPCFEDPLARLADEVGRPEGPRPDRRARERPDPDLVAELDRAETTPAAWALPLVPSWFGEGWASPDWRTRRGRLVLVPGESPAGTRLPLGSLSWTDPDYAGEDSYADVEPPLAEADAGARAMVVDAERDPGPDGAGGRGPGRLRARLPAAAGEAGGLRRAGRRCSTGPRPRPEPGSSSRATARRPTRGSSTCWSPRTPG